MSLVGFLVVGVAGLRLRSGSGSKAWLIALTMLVTSIVLTYFVIDTARNAPETFTAMLVMVALAVVLDAIWKRVRPKRAVLRRGSGRVVRRKRCWPAPKR